ncbi:MAG TPA: hypothetical protein VGI10_15600 [Polyangiaceae bacterium]|jgi:hypothetical protein
MNPHSRKFVLALTLAGAASSFALVATADSPDCVHSWPEVRYIPYGYDHIVHIRNDCRIIAVCVVTTDVNPSPIGVTVRPGEQTEVLTMRASPSREFTPKVDCKFNASSATCAP